MNEYSMPNGKILIKDIVVNKKNNFHYINFTPSEQIQFILDKNWKSIFSFKIKINPIFKCKTTDLMMYILITIVKKLAD